eukprot:1161532-Pelagomonas_calceolata.AAC.7
MQIHSNSQLQSTTMQNSLQLQSTTMQHSLQTPEHHTTNFTSDSRTPQSKFHFRLQSTTRASNDERKRCMKGKHL